MRVSKKEFIRKAIKHFVKDHSLWFRDYGNWYIGITSNPDSLSLEHGYRNIWTYWEADSIREARELEMLFLEEGMHGDAMGKTNTPFVYIFKHSGPGA